MLTKKELELIAAHIAGRLVQTETKLGVNLDHETMKDKLNRVAESRAKLIIFLGKTLPSLLPPELNRFLEEVDKVEKDMN